MAHNSGGVTLKTMALATLLAMVSGCSRDPAVASRAYMAKGDQYAQAGKFKEAAIEYRNAIKHVPQSAEAHAKLADAARGAKDANTALIEYLRVADLAPDDAAAQVRAASVYLLARRYGEARERAEAALRTAPTDADAHVVLGQALAGERDRTRSLAALAEAVRLAPESPNAHIALGGAYWADQRPADAERELKRAVTLAPSQAAPNRAVGLLLMATGRMPAAEPHWRAVATAADGDPLALADYYVAANRLPDAERELDALLKRPDTRDAVAPRLAAIQFAMGKRPEAHGTIEAAVNANPRNFAAQLLRAKLLAADGRLDDALGAARSAAAAEATSGHAYVVAAEILAAKGDDEGAAQEFDKALKADPSDPMPHLGIARLRMKQGRAEDAVAAAERAQAVGPGDPTASLVLIDALSRAGQTGRAEKETRAAIDRSPRSAPLYSRLGIVQSTTAQFADARQSFERALQLDRSSADALAGLTAVDLQTNRTREAIARLDARLRQSPDDPKLLLLAAQAKGAGGATGDSEAILKHLIDVDPSSLEAFAALGNLYLRSGRLQQARDQFRQLAQRSPNPAASTMVGMILEAEGMRREAQTQYEQTLARFPRAGVAANNLAWLYVEAGRLDEALQWATVARREMPRRAEAHDTLGWVYMQRNEVSHAVDPLAQAAELRPDNPTYQYHLAFAYSKTGATTQALEQLRRAIDTKKPFREREDAVRLATALQAQKEVAAAQ